MPNCDPSLYHIRAAHLYQALLGSEPPETGMCDDGQNPRQYEVKSGCCRAKG